MLVQVLVKIGLVKVESRHIALEYNANLPMGGKVPDTEKLLRVTALKIFNVGPLSQVPVDDCIKCGSP